MGHKEYPTAFRTITLWLCVGVIIAFVAGCRREPTGASISETYARTARPEVWQVLPHGQAQAVGLAPGDLLVLYDSIPVQTNDDVRMAQASAMANRTSGPVPVTALRNGQAVEMSVAPGPLGVMPVSARYPSSLALALEAILRHFGRFADYDWLAALTGESFTFTARAEECRAWWPGGKSGVYIEQLGRLTGLSLRSIGDEDAVRGIERSLGKGRVVLAHGGWPEHRFGFWGVATRWDARDSLVYGFVADAAEEMPLIGHAAAYEVNTVGSWADPDDIFSVVLRQALELTQVHSDTGWKSGVEAYDLAIASLDSVPFCPVCGREESQACWDRLIWAMLAHRESGRRFLEGMKLALPDQLVLLEEAIAVNDAAIAKLRGMLFSSTRLGTREDQQKLALILSRVQLDEVKLIEIYEELLDELAR